MITMKTYLVQNKLGVYSLWKSYRLFSSDTIVLIDGFYYIIIQTIQSLN